jgi:hypothetical protein
MIQLASDASNAAGLVFFPFDILHLDGDDVAARRLIERKERLAALLADTRSPLQYSDDQVGRGPTVFDRACAMKLEGIVSKRADAAYAPANRGLWLKVKCLHREEFVVVGWTDPEGSRPYLGALLLGYHDPEGRLVYAGRVGTGIDTTELERLWRWLRPLATPSMPLEVPPPRSSRFGSPVVLSACIGCAPNSSPRSSFSRGPKTTCSAKSSLSGSARRQGGSGSAPAGAASQNALGGQSHRRLKKTKDFGQLNSTAQPRRRRRKGLRRGKGH